ncbi:unnamed protein product, partial [Closterium sp. NIES-53]
MRVAASDVAAGILCLSDVVAPVALVAVAVVAAVADDDTRGAAAAAAAAGMAALVAVAADEFPAETENAAAAAAAAVGVAAGAGSAGGAGAAAETARAAGVTANGGDLSVEFVGTLAAPSPSGSSITAAAAAATTAAVAGADAAAMSARSVAIGALNGRGYPRVLAASPDSKLVGIHTSPEKRSIFKSSSGNPVNSASKSPSNAPNFFKPRNVEDNFAENPPPDPPLPTATSTARSRETISLLYTELLKRARPSPPLPPLAVPRPGSTEKSPKLGSRLISVMIRASPPPKKKTPSPPKKTANHSPKVPTKSPASASNTSPSKRGVSPPKRGTSPPKKRSPFLPKKRPPPPHSSSPPKQKSPKQPPPAKRSPPKRSPPKASPPKSPPPASPPKRRKPSSAQKSPPPPPPSPPTGSGGVDLGNAQKVLKMLQPYFDDPQFMMFAINGGLLTLMGKALNSTEKVTFFVPDPDTIKDLPDDSPLINDPAIATAVVNLHVVRGRQVTYTELTQDATGTMYMTDQHEPLVKDAASFLFNVVLRPSQGPSRATITMPNAYTDESMQ